MSIQDNTINESVAPPSSVLVTGGTGFVGAYVIRDLLGQGYKVSALRRKTNLPHFIDASLLEQVCWLDGDILDPIALADAMTGVDAVIHSAAVISFNPDDRQRMFHVNIEGTANVVNAAIENNVKRFVYVSSVAAIGKSSNGSLLNEKNNWQENKLNTNYAISKHSAEMEVWRGIGEGLNAVIVNPSTVLGYGDWHNSSSALFRNIYEGFPWYSNGATGFVDVEDVSRAIVRLLATNIHSERFILNGDNWSYRRLLETIAEGFNKRKPYREATPFLAGMAWRIEKLRSLITGKRMLLTRESAMVGRGNTRFDNRKIREALPGFTFTDLEETIKKACDRYASNKQL